MTDRSPRIPHPAPEQGMETSRIARLNDLDDYKVVDGEPDPRGWHVLTREGTRAGEVSDLIVDVAARKVRYLDVELDKDTLRLRESRHVLIPVEATWVNDDEEIVRLGPTTSELIAAPVYNSRMFSPADEDLLRRRFARHLGKSADGPAVGGRQRMVTRVEIRRVVKPQAGSLDAPR